MLPTREEAERLLREGEACHAGPWGDHCRVVAHCAESIAKRCVGLDADKAYAVGLLHDIGRRFGGRHLGHVADGYCYMLTLGYDEAARVCLTHSFHTPTTDGYIGKFDTTDDELRLITIALGGVVFDDYDRLIQLCDAISGAQGVMGLEERMLDVKRRYGAYPQDKWDNNFRLKAYFEEKMGVDLYEAVEKESFSVEKGGSDHV